jgi:hypothetical protein
LDFIGDVVIEASLRRNHDSRTASSTVAGNTNHPKGDRAPLSAVDALRRRRRVPSRSTRSTGPAGPLVLDVDDAR